MKKEKVVVTSPESLGAGWEKDQVALVSAPRAERWRKAGFVRPFDPKKDAALEGKSEASQGLAGSDETPAQEPAPADKPADEKAPEEPGEEAEESEDEKSKGRGSRKTGKRGRK